MERRERFQAHGVSPFQKRRSVKIEAEPQGVRRALLPAAAGWSHDLLPGAMSMEIKLRYMGGFLCLEESLSLALTISLSVFLNFSDVQKLPEIL